MEKVKTTKIQGGADYAKVSDRIKAFRTENPRGSIETTPLPQENGMMMFRTKVLKDKSDEFSAEATGHALQTKAGIKDFEKLETISVGRALALLGYGADGEIANSEEMEEFQEYREEKRQQQINEATEKLGTTENLKDLQKVWSDLDGEVKKYKEVEEVKNSLKEKYANQKISE